MAEQVIHSLLSNVAVSQIKVNTGNNVAATVPLSKKAGFLIFCIPVSNQSANYAIYGFVDQNHYKTPIPIVENNNVSVEKNQDAVNVTVTSTYGVDIRVLEFYT